MGEIAPISKYVAVPWQALRAGWVLGTRDVLLGRSLECPLQRLLSLG